MLGGGTVKELYEKSKGRSMHGFASTCARRRCRTSRPDRKRGSKLDAASDRTTGCRLVSARYERGSIILT